MTGWKAAAADCPLYPFFCPFCPLPAYSPVARLSYVHKNLSMKKAILPAIIAMSMLAATSAHAQVSLNVRVGIPVPTPVIALALPPHPCAAVIRPRPVIVTPVTVIRPVAPVRPIAVVHPFVRPVAVVRPVRRVVVVH